MLAAGSLSVGFTCPHSPSRSWYDAGMRPSRPVTSLRMVLEPSPEPNGARSKPIEAPPPPGFQWAEPVNVGVVVPTAGLKLMPKSQPVTSWYDGGVRLETSPPLSPAVEAALAEAAEGDDLEVEEVTQVDIANELILAERIGQGAQSEVLMGELPCPIGKVAVKVGLRMNAISREAAVLSSLKGVPGFPKTLHHEVAGPGAPGGFLVMELLGPSLDDLCQGKSSQNAAATQATAEEGTEEEGTEEEGSEKAAEGCEAAPVELSGQTLLRVGRGVVRLLRELHLAGYVHNDVKPANLLLGKGAGDIATLQPTRLHLIDFGSCTRIEGHPTTAAAAAAAAAASAAPYDADADPWHVNGPIGTASFASVAADDRRRPMRPVDDIESLVYTLTHLAGGCIPWRGKQADLVVEMKQELHTSGGAALCELTGGLRCKTAVAALEGLWAEVARYNEAADGADGVASVDYAACLAALGATPSQAEAEADAEAAVRAAEAEVRRARAALKGVRDAEAEADALSEFSIVAGLGGESAEAGAGAEAGADRAFSSVNSS